MVQLRLGRGWSLFVTSVVGVIENGNPVMRRGWLLLDGVDHP